MRFGLSFKTFICFVFIYFVELPVDIFNGKRSSTEAIRAEDLSQYAVDALQMLTTCVSARNFRRPLRFGRCIFNQFANSELKEMVVYPKIKQMIRSFLNRTIAEEHTLRFKILNGLLNRQFSSRPRYRPGYNGYSDYGNNMGGDQFGQRQTRNNYDDNGAYT